MSSYLQLTPSTFPSTMDYSVLLSLSNGTVSFEQVLPGSTTTFTVTPAMRTKAEGPTFPMDEYLSPEDREAREKGLRLVARFEHLVETDEGFRRWLQVGLDQAEAGEVFVFEERDRERE